MENFHYHNSFEIYYLLSGNRKMLIEDRVYEFCTSDIVFTNPNILHRNSALNDGFLNHKVQKITDDSCELPLKYSYMEFDTLIFSNLKSKTVKLKNNITNDTVAIDFSDFKNLLLWTIPNAQYICIEPWNGLPDYVDSNHNIAEKTDIISLSGGQVFECVHTLTF